MRELTLTARFNTLPTGRTRILPADAGLLNRAGSIFIKTGVEFTNREFRQSENSKYIQDCSRRHFIFPNAYAIFKLFGQSSLSFDPKSTRSLWKTVYFNFE